MKTKQLSERQLLGIAGLGWLFDAMDVGILSLSFATLHAEWGLSPTEMSWMAALTRSGWPLELWCSGCLLIELGEKPFLL